MTPPSPTSPLSSSWPPAGSAAHAFVADLEAPALDEGDRHHLERVRRLRAGEEVTVSDGRGRWRRCRFGPALQPTGPVVVVPTPSPALTVAIALTKGDGPERAVQKLTELGIDRIAVFPTARSVARWRPDRAGRHLERLRRVAREAAMQSRRARLPAVVHLADFAAAAALPGAVLADRDGDPPRLDRPTVLVGPEGGWAPEERAGHATVGLGDGVLRADTAAVTAGAILTALRARLVLPAGGAHSVT